MNRSLNRIISPQCLAVAMAATLFSLLPASAHAQLPQISVSLSDTVGYPGQVLWIPVMITSTQDTITGFQLGYSADRPDVIRFVNAEVFDTLIICNDPPACTVVDTTIELVTRVGLDMSGTLAQDWDYVSGTIMGSAFNARITGLADTDGDRNPYGVPPFTPNTALLRMQVQIACQPDPFGGDEAILTPNMPVTFFSDQDGQLIAPASVTGGTITVLPPVPCDLDFSGYPDAIDMGIFIQCAFFADCPDCFPVRADYNCDGVTDPLDLNVMIEYLFFAGAAPTPCP